MTRWKKGKPRLTIPKGSRKVEMTAPSAGQSSGNDQPGDEASVDHGVATALKEGKKLSGKLEYGQAISIYTRALGRFTSNRDLLFLARGRCYFKIRDFMSALDDFNTIYETLGEATTAQTLNLLSLCLLMLGEPRHAKSHAEIVICGKDSSEQQIDTAKRTISWAAEVEKELDAFQNAKRSRQWDNAKFHLDSAITYCEYSMGPAWATWQAEVALGRCDLYNLRAHRDVVLRDCQYAAGYAMAGLISFLIGEHDAAKEHSKRALADDPGHPGAKEVLRRANTVQIAQQEAATALEEERVEDALEYYFAALREVGAKPEEASGGFLRASLLLASIDILLKNHRFNDAEEHSISAMKLDKSDYRPKWTYGKVLFAKKDYQRAYTILLQARLSAIRCRSPDVTAIAEEERAAHHMVERIKERGTELRCYELLAVRPDCTVQDLKAARRHTLLTTHPDKRGDSDKFADIMKAYDLLNDPVKRQKYGYYAD